MLIIQTVFFLKINFNIFNMVLTVNTYKNVQMLQLTTISLCLRSGGGSALSGLLLLLADWSDIDHGVTATAQGVTKKTNMAA